MVMGEIIMSFRWTGAPETLAWYAACLEAEQAERDFTEAHRAMKSTGGRAGSPQDYAVWAGGGYADAADRLVRDMPVWEA